MGKVSNFIDKVLEVTETITDGKLSKTAKLLRELLTIFNKK